VEAREPEVFQIAPSAHSSADGADRVASAPCGSVIDPKDDLTTTSYKSIVAASIYFAFAAMP
jgi:hypothetical protein